ncbi:hypothetical protein AB832_06625 [Flavobacteriaceae bacterium (ex Bugula neritina AB1)]|nr:hypothetical protein AB832_06625 [Flavobacteriaceae bacterium (ex Bugula neritina AB1)]
MTSDIYTEAIKEAYASAPIDTVVINTLEIHHKTFTTPIRVVRNYEDVRVKLETNAPVDADKYVTFASYPFDFTLPPVEIGGVPEVIVTIENIHSNIMRYIEKAIYSDGEIEAIYRPYLSDDLSLPQWKTPLSFVLTDFTADLYQISARARLFDLANTRFPRENYTISRFPTIIY